MVLADSHGVSTVLLGMQLVSLNFRLQDFHFLWCGFQPLRLVARFHVAVPQPQQVYPLV
jgi:hypothetical protein